MPFVNDRFYANLLYGRALERARAADEDRAWSETPDTEPTPEIMLAGGHPAQIHRSGHHRHHANGPDDYDAASTPEAVGNQIYNETSGLRPTTDQGPGSDEDLQEARMAIGHVIHNRAVARKLGGLASPHLDPREGSAIRTYPSAAYDAHGASLHAARVSASKRDPTNGALHFYLDDGTHKPPGWARENTPVAVYGPFRNEAGHGDVRRGAGTRIQIFKEPR